MKSYNYIDKYLTLRKLLRSQWYSQSVLENLQVKKLKRMIRFVYANSKYYHNLMKQIELHPSDIKCLNDLTKFPLLTKENLKLAFYDIVPRTVNLNNCWRPFTSGSTGIPLKLVFDKKAENFTNAVLLRANFSVGQKFRDKWVSIINQVEREKTWFQKLGILNQYRLFYTSPEVLFNQISKIRPKILSGYTSSIFLLSKYIRESGKTDFLKPKLVFPTGEILHQNIRKFINEVFMVEVFDRFGCAELGRTAWECEKHEGYHIDLEAVIVEIIGKNGEPVSEGEFGQIAYTGLYNYSLPLIRYLVGDIASKEVAQCSCGRGLPLMNVTGGRSDSYPVNDTGEVFSFRVITTILREYKEIFQFKMIQHELNFIELKIIPNQFWNSKSKKQIITAIQNVIGKGVEIDINLVNNIEQEKSGKILSFVSKLDRNLLI